MLSQACSSLPSGARKPLSSVYFVSCLISLDEESGHQHKEVQSLALQVELELEGNIELHHII